MFEEMLAVAAVDERMRMARAEGLSREAVRLHGGPNAAVWLVRWAVEPWAQPRRARRPRSTSGHSSWTME